MAVYNGKNVGFVCRTNVEVPDEFVITDKYGNDTLASYSDEHSESEKKVFLVGEAMLPDVTTNDEGKVLAVDEKGNWVAKEVEVVGSSKPIYDEVNEELIFK